MLSKLHVEPVTISNISEIDDPNEHIIFGDNVFFTEELLKEFLCKSQENSGNTVCALKSGTTTLRTVVSVQKVQPVGNHIEYDLHFIPQKQSRGKKSAIIISPDYLSEGIRLPKHFCGIEKYLIPFTTKVIVQINHWSNIWAINVILALADIAKLQQISKFKQIILLLKSRSFNKWNILRKSNKIGKKCDIHPTACIEGSTIGDNVSIGAGVVVRGSIIGDNVTLGNSVVVEASVLGEKSTVLHGHIMFSVIYPELFSVSQLISASLIGRKSFTGSGVTLTDYRLDKKNITVIQDGIKVDTGNRLMGSCLGHDVYLGSGCIVAPGRSIPSGMRIAPSKERVIETIVDL